MTRDIKKLERMILNDVEYLLDVEQVEVEYMSFSEHGGESSSTLAVASYKENTIYVNADNLDGMNDITYINALAHELRHLWQYNVAKTNVDFAKYFEKHKKSIDIGIEAYNSQFLEMDANAFAVFFLEGLGYRLTLDSFSDELRERTYERAREIKQEFIEKGMIERVEQQD